MSPDTLSPAEQLRIQARGIITQGRYPFRKVTTDSTLLTSEGRITPDLVFWINRDSCIAGGCVFFSVEDEPSKQILKHGQACADALALNQFATWGPAEASIWQADTLKKRFSIKPLSDLDGLTELLDQFKILAVIEAKSNSELTSWHLTNLCLQSVNQGVPGLSAYLRRKDLSDTESSTYQARSKLILCVARMLSALYTGTIPAQTKPENLDAVLKNATSTDLKGPVPSTEPELDKGSSILLHNLLRRLEQIRLFGDNPERARAMLDQILAGTIPKGCSNQTPSFKIPRAQISVFTPEVEPDSLNIEIDTGARLLIKNLVRKMGKIETKKITQHEQVFSITAPVTPSHTSGCFTSLTKPDGVVFETLNTHMRLAWPGRRIQLTKSTPMGLWQFTYILGIIGEGSSIYAQLAPELFQASGCDKVLELVHSCTTLVSAAYIPGAQSVELLINKAPSLGKHTIFTGTDTASTAWHYSNQGEARDDDWKSTFYTTLNLDTRHESGLGTQRHSGGNKELNLRQQLSHELDSQGIPEFPAAYIYHISADELEEHSLAHPPWNICQSFMGSHSLCNNLGDTACEATGAKAHALVLASYLHKSVLIPQNEEQCNTILHNYLGDLRGIHMHILEEAHVHLKTSAAAKRFGNKFWKELPLPPWKVCQDIAADLGIDL